MASGTISINGVHMSSRYIKGSGEYEHRIVKVNGEKSPKFPGEKRLQNLTTKILSTEATVREDMWPRITTKHYVSEIDRWLLLSAIIFYCR